MFFFYWSLSVVYVTEYFSYLISWLSTRNSFEEGTSCLFKENNWRLFLCVHAFFLDRNCQLFTTLHCLNKWTASNLSPHSEQLPYRPRTLCAILFLKSLIAHLVFSLKLISFKGSIVLLFIHFVCFGVRTISLRDERNWEISLLVTYFNDIVSFGDKCWFVLVSKELSCSQLTVVVASKWEKTITFAN